MANRRIGPVGLLGSRRGWHKPLALMSVGVALGSVLNVQAAEGDNLSVSANVSNLTNKAPDRYVGEPGSYATGFERHHYMNGRIFGLGVRYKFDR
jgi:outer membrane receptor protein involved in Fe transport